MPLRRLRCQALIFCPTAFPRLGAHGRREAHEIAHRATGEAAPEAVAEEVEAGVLRFAPVVRVLAVDDLGLLGMQLEAERPEPVGDEGQKPSGLFLGVAVDDDVIRVALERATRVRPGHPPIECVVHEEVSQQRQDR